MQLTGNPQMQDGHDKPVTADDRRQRGRRARSVAIALILGGLVILFYLVTIAKLGPSVMERPL
jgi:predicted HTH domain antitoxin